MAEYDTLRQAQARTGAATRADIDAGLRAYMSKVYGIMATGMAVFGVRVDEGSVLNDGDRLELLRALTIDPKDARRKRAEARSVKHKKW